MARVQGSKCSSCLVCLSWFQEECFSPSAMSATTFLPPTKQEMPCPRPPQAGEQFFPLQRGKKSEGKTPVVCDDDGTRIRAPGSSHDSEVAPPNSEVPGHSRSETCRAESAATWGSAEAAGGRALPCIAPHIPRLPGTHLAKAVSGAIDFRWG